MCTQQCTPYPGPRLEETEDKRIIMRITLAETDYSTVLPILAEGGLSVSSAVLYYVSHVYGSPGRIQGHQVAQSEHVRSV